MSNPYQPPISSAQGKFANPLWYWMLDNSNWFLLAFIIATSLVPTKFEGLVWWGLIGLMVCTSILLILQQTAFRKDKLFVPLSVSMIRKKSLKYQQAIASFQAEQRLLYDDVVFMLQSNNIVVCEMVTDFAGHDESAAIELAHRCEAIFNSLVSQSEEFATATNGRTLHISILSDATHKAHEVCRYVDGRLQWSS